MTEKIKKDPVAEKVTRNSELQCTLCDKTFERKVEFSLHVREKHIKDQVCQTIDLNVNKEILQRHHQDC